MKIEINRISGGYNLSYRVDDDFFWGLTETMDYIWYSKREAVKRFKEHLKVKYPHKDFGF